MGRTTHDIFICHAGEDKNPVARPLAHQLKESGVNVWFDEFSLKWGDKLMEKINEGLLKSLFGIVIFSPNFFGKKWPEMELNALVELTQSGEKKILPLLYDMNHEDLRQRLPILSGIKSKSWNDGLDNISNDLLELVKKKRNEISVQHGFVDEDFKNDFDDKLSLLVKQLKHKSSSINLENLIDYLIMLLKSRIEKWDTPSIKYATTELFLNLYQFNEKQFTKELYPIFKDLFIFAHTQRKHILGVMISELNLIMFQAWLDLDLGKGEKASQLLLRLAMDFINQDMGIVKDCIKVIDNLAADLCNPAILSKEILLASAIFEKSNAGNDIVEEVSEWIRMNDVYAAEGDVSTYLIDAMKISEKEKDNFDISLEKYKNQFILPALDINIDSEIGNFVQYVGETDYDEDIQYLLKRIIQIYRPFRPNIAVEIKTKIFSDTKEKKRFLNVVRSDKFLNSISGFNKE